MKKTFFKKIRDLFARNNALNKKHNLIGAWKGKKTKVLKRTEKGTELQDVSNYSDSLKVNRDFKFSWSKAKTGFIQFKNNCTNLVFKTQQMLGLDQAKNCEIKRLTFNKLILVEHNKEKNTFVEYHFEKDFRDYNVGI